MVGAIVLCCLVAAACGAVKKGPIAHGEIVGSRAKYSWAVRIVTQYRYSNKGDPTPRYRKYRCTGSFIDKYWAIVTAARCVAPVLYCVEGNNLTTLCGREFVHVYWTGGLLSGRSKGKSVKIKTRNIVFLDDGWKDGHPGVNIALVFLGNTIDDKTRPMTCRKHSAPQPIKLAKIGKLPDYPKDGILVSFGKHRIGNDRSHNEYFSIQSRKMYQVPFTFKTYANPSPDCKGRSCSKQTVPLMFKGYPHAPQSEMSSPKNPRDPPVTGACMGDNGGSYMVEGDTGMTLRGILSDENRFKDEMFYRAHRCNAITDPSYFTDLNNKRIRDWILDVLRRRYSGLGWPYDTIPATCP